MLITGTHLSTSLVRMCQLEVLAGLCWGLLVPVGLGELLEGGLELLVRLDDHLPLLVRGQLVAEHAHGLVAAQRIRTLKHVEAHFLLNVLRVDSFLFICLRWT